MAKTLNEVVASLLRRERAKIEARARTLIARFPGRPPAPVTVRVAALRRNKTERCKAA